MSLRLETFEEALHRRLGREYRIRWSPRKEVFCIEQQVAMPRMDLPPSVRQRDPDLWQRVRDGYHLVAQVCPRPWMKCEKCQERLEVPALEWREVKCPACYASRERNNIQYFVAYFPLCEKLLQHLESTSPKRGYEWVEEMKAENRQVVLAQQRDWRNYAEAGLLDYRNIIGGNPFVGAGRGPASFGERNRV